MSDTLDDKYFYTCNKSLLIPYSYILYDDFTFYPSNFGELVVIDGCLMALNLVMLIIHE